MTMHLLPVYFTSNNTRKRKTKSKKTTEHDEWLRKRGVHPDQLKSKKTTNTKWKQDYAESIHCDRSDYRSSGLSGLRGVAAKRDIMTNLHKEPKHVQDAILEKASRVMPLYNKGGLQLLSPKDDLTTVGTKSRRG
jgi:hypothetical protein